MTDFVLSLAGRIVADGEVLSDGDGFVNFGYSLLVERRNCNSGRSGPGFNVDSKTLNGFNSIDGLDLAFDDQTFFRQVKQVQFRFNILRLSVLWPETDLKISLRRRCQFSLWI